MSRIVNWMVVSLCIGGLGSVSWSPATAGELAGFYLESRTCQVYTGPCFAAGETGLAGREAVMAWGFENGSVAGEEVAGLHLVAIVQTDTTLGFEKIEASDALRVRIIVDEQATAAQERAMLEFLQRTNPVLSEAICDVRRHKITMELDRSTLRGSLDAGRYAKLQTRKANADDCICSNESAYYPPLAPVDHFVAGVALEFQGRGMQRNWSTSDTRSAYMATFQLADGAHIVSGS